MGKRFQTVRDVQMMRLMIRELETIVGCTEMVLQHIDDEDDSPTVKRIGRLMRMTQRAADEEIAKLTELCAPTAHIQFEEIV